MGEKRKEFSYGEGCNSCADTGYHGRCGVYEILEMSEETRRLVLANASAGAIREKAVREGMVSMLHDGMLKVKQGITTPYELIRNVYSMAE
jgi:type II secretory ATPase GspE/PulE/Tfp pilus assembly ATPase PilB-like protein